MSDGVTPTGQYFFFRDDEHSLRASFERFDRENPAVYQTLVKLTRQWMERRPGRRCGIGMLFEVARWHLTLSTTGEPLKLNNNYRAFYARKLMRQHPEFEGVFETRQQRDEADAA
jgi:hypothetical protein